MNINERIKEIRKHFCDDSNVKFARRLSKGVNTTSNYTRNGYSVGGAVANDIIRAFPGVNAAWLLSGEGEMLKGDASQPLSPGEGRQMIPLLPIAAQGGSLNDFIVSVKTDDCEKIVSPIKGVDFAMSVSGDSMEPEYPSGSKILIKKINEKAFIEWGRVYVLDTCNGSVIKRIMPSEDGASVICESINIKYPPFKVDFTDIYGVYRVLMLLSEK